MEPSSNPARKAARSASVFNGGIPFDEVLFGSVVRIREPQVMNAGLRGDFLLLQGQMLVKQLQFFARGKVVHVKTSTGFPRQRHGGRTGLPARLFRPNQRMVRRRQTGFPHFGQVVIQVGPNRAFVLAVGNELVVYFAEDALQSLGVVHQHVSSGGTHEDLDARNGALGGLLQLVQIGVCGAQVEGVIGPGHLRRSLVFFLQLFQGHGLRHRVGLLHVAGNSTQNRRSGFRRNRALVR